MATSDSSPQIDPNSGIPDLIRSLADDSKRLAGDEISLAKLELQDSVRTGSAAALRLGLAAAFGIVAAVALTVLMIAAVSAMLGRRYWAGASIVGLIEVIVGTLAVRRGVKAVRAPSYPLQASRESLKDTAAWLRQPGKR